MHFHDLLKFWNNIKIIKQPQHLKKLNRKRKNRHVLKCEKISRKMLEEV